MHVYVCPLMCCVSVNVHRFKITVAMGSWAHVAVSVRVCVYMCIFVRVFTCPCMCV
jgi:hypothetical protein